MSQLESSADCVLRVPRLFYATMQQGHVWLRHAQGARQYWSIASTATGQLLQGAAAQLKSARA